MELLANRELTPEEVAEIEDEVKYSPAMEITEAYWELKKQKESYEYNMELLAEKLREISKQQYGGRLVERYRDIRSIEDAEAFLIKESRKKRGLWIEWDWSAIGKTLRDKLTTRDVKVVKLPEEEAKELVRMIKSKKSNRFKK